MSNERTYRIGADIGGTFTDIVIADDLGAVYTKKISSTPDNYGRAIVDGIKSLLLNIGARPGQVTDVVHGTTIATNTILEGRGAKTALITTRGFRDVLEIARLRAPVLYNLGYTKPRPLALRRHRYEVTERLRSDGSVDTPLNEAGVRAIAAEIRKAGIEAIAVSLLHSYANPQHEVRVRDLLREIVGNGMYITCSHEILPEIREYERTSTAVVNAYLGPIVTSYLEALIRELQGIGIKAPLRVMHSNGGVMSAETVMYKPATIIESGPAAGVIAGAFVGARSGIQDLITVDMGGTTAKAAIVEKGEPARTTEYEVGAGINLSSKLIKGGGHAVKLPFIDVSEIGAGGGSLVRLDEGGLVRVGPESAGSVPGPVGYDTGGQVVTLTDAFIALGYLNPKYLAGGEVPLNRDKAVNAVEQQIARPAGLELAQAAFGIVSVAAATMTRAVKAVSVYRGRDPREFAMFAFGGNGPVIAHAIARLVDMKTVVIPPSPGVFSAFGLLYADTQHEFMQTLFRRIDELGDQELSRTLEVLSDKARAALEQEGHALADIELQASADLRYVGQAYELTVPLPENFTRIATSEVVEGFEREHRRTYGHASKTDPVDLVNVRITGRVATASGQRHDGRRAVGAHRAQEPTFRTAYFGPEWGHLETPVLPRAALRGANTPGPLIVEEYDSTVVVPPDAAATTDEFNNILITF